MKGWKDVYIEYYYKATISQVHQLLSSAASETLGLWVEDEE